MKKILTASLFVSFILSHTVFCNAQTNSVTKKSSDSLTLKTDSITFTTGLSFGFQPTNKFDTIPSVMLITECDTCQSKSVTGYFIRQRRVFSGDRMPPGDYSDYWMIIGNLDKDKMPFKKWVRIWVAVQKNSERTSE